jgi:hypothetical protein
VNYASVMSLVAYLCVFVWLGSAEKQTDVRQIVSVPEQRIFEAEREDLSGLEDDWDSLSKPSAVAKAEGWVDDAAFLGLGFAARGLLGRRKEWEAAELKGWWYSGRFATTPLN